MKIRNICAIIIFSFAMTKPLLSAEPGCDFAKGNCGLAEVIQRVHDAGVPLNTPGPVRVFDPITVNPGQSFHEIARNIRSLAPYVATVQENNISLQTFDAKGARDNGFSTDMVFLVQEIIQFQNGMMTALSSGNKNVMAEPLDAAKYPRLVAFFKIKPYVRPFGVTDGERIEPCGDYSYPVPDRRPDRWEAYSFNPEQTLFDMGFHRTAGYACRDYVEVDCDHDFTSGTWNNGPYGYCESPRFRMHGATDEKRPTWYSIHGAEPNPELHSYVWPYYDWGNYVYWWHQKF